MGRDGRRRHRATTWLLAVPLLALVWPPLYNRHDPAIFGVPFFYAYQLMMIPLAAALMITVYRLGRAPRQGPARRDPPAAGDTHPVDRA